MNKKMLIGDRAFYRRVFAVMTPILIQNVITNFVNLLDNLMVGQVGTEPMSGVAIVNQLIFVFNLSLFGALAGPGIFTAQYYGSGDNAGVRETFRAKWYVALTLVAAFCAAYLGFGRQLISLFLHEGEEALDLAVTLQHGEAYLHVILLQTLPFAVVQVYASTLRETGETLLPMKAGIAAVFVNLVFNYLLIFGKLGLPAMGVEGAAVATVIARLVEGAIVVVWTHRHDDRARFIEGAYRSLRVDPALAKRMLIMGAPLLLNEALWSSGMTVLSQCYSLRGLEVVSAANIANTINHLFFCMTLSMGNTVSILIGQTLGSGDLERAVDEDRKLLALAVALGVVVGGAVALVAPLLPRLYNTTDSVKALATSLLVVYSLLTPVQSFTNVAYFTLRSGGKTIITFIFDCAFIWGLSVPAAFILAHYTSVPILPLFIAVQALELIKSVIGYFLLRSRKWVNNLVSSF